MDFEQARFNMVEQQVRPWDVLDFRVLDAMTTIARDAFVPDEYKSMAYADTKIPLGHGQTMMPPVVEGRMLQALMIQEDDVALEIGTGSGYITACLAELGAEVDSVEIIPEFKFAAQKALDAEGYGDKVTLRSGDGSEFWTQRARYER